MINTFDGWDSELYHHGIKGQKWGVRRYQNSDGSLTEAGRKRYGYGSELTKAGQKRYAKEYRKLSKLNEKADINLQASRYATYSNRAKKGLAVTGALGSAALGNRTIGSTIAGNLFNKNVGIGNKWADKNYKYRIEEIDNNYNAVANWNAKNAKSRGELDRLNFANNDFRNREYSKAVNESNALKADTYKWSKEHYLDANNTVTKVLTAATAVSAGYTAYNVVKAAAAKYRMSDVGHSKAVAKAEAQVQKMQKMFGNVKLDEIMKRK